MLASQSIVRCVTVLHVIFPLNLNSFVFSYVSNSLARNNHHTKYKSLQIHSIKEAYTKGLKDELELLFCDYSSASSQGQYTKTLVQANKRIQIIHIKS